MSGGIELAKAYVTLIPSLQGAQTAITSALVPSAAAAGAKAGAGLGAMMLAGVKKYGAAIATAVTVGAVAKVAKDSVAAFSSVNTEVATLKRTTGGSVADVSALRGALQLSGVSTDKAAISLKLFAKNLTTANDGGQKATEMQQLLGTAFTDSRGQVENMTSLLPRVAEQFKTMSDGPQKTALALKLFGRSGADMLPFLNKGSGGIAELEAKAQSLGLTLDDQSNAKWVAYRGATRDLQATFQGLKVTIGGAIIPAFTSVAKSMSSSAGPAIKDFITSFNSQDVKSRIADIVTVVTNIGKTAGPILSSVSKMVIDLAVPLSKNETAVKAIAGAFVAWKAVDMATSLAKTAAGIASTTVELGKSVVAWGVATAAKAKDKIESLAIMALYAKDFVVGIASTVGKLGAQAFAWAANTAAMVASKVAMVASTVAQWALNVAMSANPIALIVIAIAALVAGLVWFFTQTDVGRKAWSTFVGWLVGAWNWVANSAKGIWGAVSGFFSGLWSGITSFATNSWNGFLQWLTGLWNTFVMANLLIWDTLSSFFSGLWSGITSFATNAWNGLVNWMTGLFRAHVAAVRTIWGAITGFFSGLWNGIKTTAQSVWNGLVSWFTGIPGKITSALGNMGSLLSQKGRDLINGLVNGAKGIWSSVTGWFGGIGGKILSAIGQANNILFNAGKSIIDGFFNGLKDSWKNVTDFVGGIASWIAANKGPISYDATLLVGHGRAIMQGLDSGLQSENGWRSTVAGVADSISGMSASLTGSTVAAAGAGDVYVQNPFTGEYLLARVGDVSRKEMAATARRAR